MRKSLSFFSIFVLSFFIFINNKKINNNIFYKNIAKKNININKNNIKSNRNNIDINNENLNTSDVLMSAIERQKKINDANHNYTKVVINNNTDNTTGSNMLSYHYFVSYNDYSNVTHKYDSSGYTPSDYILGSSDKGQEHNNSAYIPTNNLFKIKICINSIFQSITTVTLNNNYKQYIEYSELLSGTMSYPTWYSIEATGILTCPKIQLFEHLSFNNKDNKILIGNYNVYNYWNSDSNWSIPAVNLFIGGAITALGLFLSYKFYKYFSNMMVRRTINITNAPAMQEASRYYTELASIGRHRFAVGAEKTTGEIGDGYFKRKTNLGDDSFIDSNECKDNDEYRTKLIDGLRRYKDYSSNYVNSLIGSRVKYLNNETQCENPVYGSTAFDDWNSELNESQKMNILHRISFYANHNADGVWHYATKLEENYVLDRDVGLLPIDWKTREEPVSIYGTKPVIDFDTLMLFWTKIHDEIIRNDVLLDYYKNNYDLNNLEENDQIILDNIYRYRAFYDNIIQRYGFPKNIEI